MVKKCQIQKRSIRRGSIGSRARGENHSINNAKNKINSLEENKGFRGLISINTYKDEDYIHIDVKDNAGSIPEEIINHIFEPFFTTKANGTGFGLYMAKIIIEDKMSGSISVKNEEQNVVFSIKIPIRNK